MNWFLLLYNLFLQGLVVWTVFVMVRLVQEYRIPFLRDFLAFVLGFSLFGFVIFFLQDVLLPLVDDGGERVGLTLQIVMVFLVMPVTLVTLYFLVRAALRLVGEDVPRWAVWAYWLPGLIFMGLTAMAVEYYLRTEIIEYLNAVYSWGFMGYNQLWVYSSLAYAHSRAHALDDARRRHLVLGWTRILGAFFFIYYILLWVYSDIPWIYYTLGLWFYLVIILPVIFLKRVLPREFLHYQRIRTPVADMGRRAKELGLSPRETEIVTRVLAGRSNRDIEDELFISRRTVKNHVYNIYRKLKVRNRVELFRLFLDS